VVLLNPLARPSADRDHIYGVIKGTSINHGGKTNGYTVPNPAAQAQVIERALRDSKIHPRSISYIEAHGTGTSSGDPIEIAGLTQSFAKLTPELQYCAIGSVKSNIGHLESAAGIASLTKVLLQMKHRMLVPSLHSDTLNPYIDFSGTPFSVQRTLSEWKRPVVMMDGREVEHTRVAGISSFGAGGANAHLIVEEYTDPLSVDGVGPEVTDGRTSAGTLTPERPALVVLSARTAERLQVKAQQLLAYMCRNDYTESDLLDIAYTLQTGREAMEHRLAFTASSIAVMKEKLAAITAGKADHGEVEECYRAEVKLANDTVAVLNTDEDAADLAAVWIDKGKYARLLEMWVKGLSFDWERLYRGGAAGTRSTRKRAGLPTYPFESERYWVSVGAREETTDGGDWAGANSREEPFDVGFYDALLDSVMSGSCSVAEAAGRAARRVCHQE
jgi:polyketide synthase PksN